MLSAGLITAVLAVAPMPDVPSPAAPAVRQTDLFVSGAGGYDTYRIPSITVTPGGSLLAFCEGRLDGSGDAGNIDILMRRSDDHGRTWGDVVVLRDDGANTCGNPCVVADHRTGGLVLLSTHNLGHDHEREIIDQTSEGTRTVWIMRSDDDGLTWSEPEDITTSVKLPEWTWYATGPGSGIQIRHGEHAGRLVIPCDHIEAETKHYYSHVMYSDDHGATWQLGGSSPEHQVNECEVVELADGRLMLNMRNYDRSKKTRQVCVSADGGATWTDQRHDPALPEPICQASIHRTAWPTDDRAGVILFSNPASGDSRVRMTVRASFDDGVSWPVARELHAGSSAYSSLVAGPDGGAFCLYEADGYGRIVLAELPAAWLGTDLPSRPERPSHPESGDD